MPYFPESGTDLLPFEACSTCVFSLHCMAMPRKEVVGEHTYRTRFFEGTLCRSCGVQVRVEDRGNEYLGKRLYVGFMDYGTFISVPGPCRRMTADDTPGVICPACEKKTSCILG